MFPAVSRPRLLSGSLDKRSLDGVDIGMIQKSCRKSRISVKLVIQVYDEETIHAVTSG